MSIIIGISAQTLKESEREALKNPNCAGVILFTRNYENPSQLTRLCEQIRAAREDILICTDHEGGRVQRFRMGFTAIPSAADFGDIFLKDSELSQQLTHFAGFIFAYELRQCGLDFSFAPVLDLLDPISTVIGRRAFSADPAIVTTLASALRQGMRRAGMAAVGKHFPGHGRVLGDSHHVLPRDERSECERQADLFPFMMQIRDGIEGIMPAHIVLPEHDSRPAGFSPYFLGLLRQMHFTGAIISDDLDMQGAAQMGSAPQRVQAALSAGADAALICNDFAGIAEALSANYQHDHATQAKERLAKLQGKAMDLAALQSDYREAKAFLFSNFKL